MGGVGKDGGEPVVFGIGAVKFYREITVSIGITRRGKENEKGRQIGKAYVWR